MSLKGAGEASAGECTGQPLNPRCRHGSNVVALPPGLARLQRGHHSGCSTTVQGGGKRRGSLPQLRKVVSFPVQGPFVGVFKSRSP
jgi:hypothetical protein